MPSVAGIIHTGMGELLYERGDLDEARRLLEEGIEHGRRSGEAKILVYGYVNLARVLMAEGDAEGAHSLIREAGRLTPRWPLIWAWQARFWLAQGDVHSAARWSREYEATEDYMSYPRHFERITMARVLLGEGRTDEALDSLGNLLAGARSEGRMSARDRASSPARPRPQRTGRHGGGVGPSGTGPLAGRTGGIRARLRR